MKDFDAHLIELVEPIEHGEQENQPIAKVFALNLNRDLLYFDGHFDDRPILPAVAQLHLIDRLVKAYFESDLMFSGMKQLKFMSPILPGQSTVLRIEEKKNNTFGFEFKTKETVNAKGLLCYQGQDDD